MTIEFRHVDKRTRKTISPIAFKDVSFSISEHERTALLGYRGQGLEVILDLICGADSPDSGDIIRDAALSWPIPGTSFMHRHLSFEANANFIARLYGVNPRSFRETVIEMARVQELRRERMDHCPKAALSRFAFTLGVSLPFDLYVLTNTGVGDKDDRARFKSIIEELGRRSGILVAGSNGKAAQEFCEKAFVIDAGQVVYHDDIEEAIEHFESTKVKPPASEPEFMDEGEEEELEQDDF
jgi:capsular polysaccharide transport system ATP-binding protein